MKKTLLLLALVFLLSSCFGDSEDVIKAKQDLGVIETDEADIIVNEEFDSSSDAEGASNSDPRIQISQISGEKLLELGTLNYQEFKAGYSKIIGKTLGNVEKISVSFENEDSEFPDDLFTLTKFKAGDSSFEYNASSKFKVLDFGINRYIFTAYSGNDESKLELLILVSENDDKVLNTSGTIETLDEKSKEELTQIKETIGTESDFVFTDLPQGGDFGDVVKLGEDAFTYSDIKGLEIGKERFAGISCGKNEDTDKYLITELLSEKQKSWYYWNTCRDIIKGKGISFFVTRLDGESYVYEKHYLDTNHGLYGTYELESGGGADKDNLSDKNKELKERNDDFVQLGVVDSLFKKIVD